VYRGIIAPGTPFLHGLTNTGHPVTCAVALKNIEIILDEDLVGNAARMGSHVLAQLRARLNYPWVGEVRGRGLIAAIELVTDRQTKQRFSPELKVGDVLRRAATDNGLIVRSLGDVIGVAPPLSLTRSEADELIQKLDRAVKALEPVWETSQRQRASASPV
jgi:4-aminobutyrate--pyruvate transaminase